MPPRTRVVAVGGAEVEIESAGQSPERSTEQRAQTRYPLQRPGVRSRLIGEIAHGEASERTLAADYGVAPSAINAFKKRWAAEIERRRRDLAGALDDLWISRKHDRVAAYQQDVAAIDQELGIELDKQRTSIVDPDSGQTIEIGGPDARVIERLTRAKHRALRSVAEELGQLPNRITLVQESRAPHVLEGCEDGV